MKGRAIHKKTWGQETWPQLRFQLFCKSSVMIAMIIAVMIVAIAVVTAMPLAAVAFYSPGTVLISQIKRTQERPRIKLKE